MLFIKEKLPFVDVEMHQMVAVEGILFPNSDKYHCSFMGMTFEDKSDSVKIDTDIITLASGERESFELRLNIPGLREFAETNN